ncbi:MAG TPA: (2Fe-2S)-binding protein [Chitinophagaceae bacterium]|nr:(2Fe-2S)-binding protein [Chitinophagaceae bacterium]
MSIKITVTVNGVKHVDRVEPRMLLVNYLRETLGLTGTHVGCDTSSCGACTIHLNDKAAKSCSMLAVQADKCRITTIEGLAKDGELHPLQEGFNQCHGLQCGFCTPGMIMTAADLLRNNRKPSEQEIRAALDGNFCRCTGYHNIVKSVQYAVEKMKAAKPKPKKEVAV